MSRMHLMIGTPAYDGSLGVGYVRALIETERALRDAGIPLALHFTVQNSLITHARNEVVAAFLASDATDLLFVDSDIAWQAADVLRLLRHDVPVVAGAYRRKTETVSYVVRFPDRAAVARDRASGLVAASRVGAGFLRLRRDALERMVAEYAELAYDPGGGGTHHALFDTAMIDGTFCGEDWTFCARWLAIGGTLWVDPEIPLVHVGRAEFPGRLADVLVRR
jgi:hypothetical protein